MARPLLSAENGTEKARPEASSSHFPYINIMNYDRGTITRITITILAPNDALHPTAENGESLTVANYTERETLRRLRKALVTLDPSILTQSPEGEGRVPIETSPTEITSHFSRLYILLVAHTSAGFRIGHDALLGENRGHKPSKSKHGKHQNHKKGQGPRPNKKSSEAQLQRVSDLIDNCVQRFVEELSETHPDTTAEQGRSTGSTTVRRSGLDSHMRDQIVVFEALGNLGDKLGIAGSEAAQAREDERYWTLHTQTAQWVCQKMLGDVPDN